MKEIKFVRFKMSPIIIFNNHIDFLKELNRLQRFDKDKSDFLYLSVDLNGIDDVRVELDFISRQHLLGYSGFKSSKLIKVSLKSSFGLKSNISYKFKSRALYDKFNRGLRMLEWR